MAKRAFLLGALSAMGCLAQFYPAGAHVNLYFPHLADGGPSFGQWQTSLEFVNPSTTLTAHVELRIYGDIGIPLNLDFGSGARALHTFTVPPSGSITLRSTIASIDKIVTGQAIATSDVPLQGTVLFRNIVNTAAVVEVSAPATLPTSKYLSPATRDLGIALANISGAQKYFRITVLNSSGASLTTFDVGVAGLGHQSFNLSQMASLPSDYSGSVTITPVVPGDQVLAWTLNVERGLVSTLPTGPLDWPVSHPDRIQLVFRRLLSVAPALLAGLGNNLGPQTAPNLVISTASEVNAVASPNQSVQINLALSELVSDSPSELAFLVAHELAHIAQNRGGALTVLLPNDLANKESDADLIAMILVLSAGFDPYGAAGAISKLNMANGSPGLVSPFFDGLSDPTTAFGAARLNSMLGVITSACSYATMSGFCAPYKTTIHPHFPASAPL